MALRQAGRLSEAEAVLRQATLAAPRSAEAHHHLGGILAQQGRRTEAEAAWRRTLALAPGAPSTEAALGALLLADGRYAEGFRLFESRHVIARMAKPRLPYPEWRGEDLTGRKLLIWPEQGFGDQIQFARFAPLAAAAGADVTLLCLPPLQRLFAASLGVRVLAASGQVEFPDPDVWVMAGSLAGRMGVTVETVPGAPYLRPVDPPAPAPDGFRVGVMTAGNPAHANDTHRSLPAAMAERLRAGLPGAVVDLRPEATGARDFADSAQVIAGLDLVVAVDTSVAHLAGALGKPVFVLLSAVNTDWRWLRERSDSPWYPSARLYRQAAADDWAPVIDRVLADAHAMAHGSG
jgi:tetratricopeptide (TPR) repeat protein